MATITRPPTGLMTAEEFYEFTCRPENADRHFELDEGRVIELPNPKKLHGVVCMRIGFQLESYARRMGRGQVASNDAGVILGRSPDTVRGPDMAYFAEQQSMAELAAEGYAETPPVLAVEVLSPDDRPGRVARKVAQYLRAGVKLVWVVDPEICEIAVHRTGADEPVLLDAEAVLTGGEVLPGFECRAGEFFDLPETAGK